ncbi:MAG TPA: phosphomannomutase/phosphoglucomutase [Chloroflexota bacterium]|jgi:phosphomannomutase|nr:phosphomannomutase/phosphoglucomutase [Chloroflexota bacterium]
MTTTTTVNPTIFREYDIRGIVGEDLTPEVLTIIGRSYGTLVNRKLGRPGRIVVGRDVRASSKEFSAAYIDGLKSTGCEAVDVREVPTPVLYFAVGALDADGGTVITASHNPPAFNGLKMRWRSGGSSVPLDTDEVQELYKIIDSGDFAAGEGSSLTHDILGEYIAYVKSRFKLNRRLKVALDSGNGVAGPTALTIFQDLGCEVVPLFIEPDSSFPNHIPNPLKEENLVDLIAAVKREKCDLGIGLDGDGDRCGVIDNAGGILWPDQYLIPLARQALQNGPAAIIFDVKTSLSLQEDIQARGGIPIMWKTGYPNISEKRKQEHAPLAGEFSGHVFFNDERIDFDDGTFTGCNVLSYLANHSESLVEVIDSAPHYVASSEQRLFCPDTEKFRVIKSVQDHYERDHKVITIDGARVVFGDGWGLVRASNTEPNLTMRFEAKTADKMNAIRDGMLAHLATYPEVDVTKIL